MQTDSVLSVYVKYLNNADAPFPFDFKRCFTPLKHKGEMYLTGI